MCACVKYWVDDEEESGSHCRTPVTCTEYTVDLERILYAFALELEGLASPDSDAIEKARGALERIAEAKKNPIRNA